MLVLARYKGQSLIIGWGADAVEIKIHSINNDGQVKLAIDAPKTIPIWRSEIYRRVFASSEDRENGENKENKDGQKSQTNRRHRPKDVR